MRSCVPRPSSSVASQLATALQRRADTAFPVRTDQINSVGCQSLSKLIAVGGFVINDTFGVSILQSQLVQQWLDQNDFIAVGRFGIDTDRDSVRIDADHHFRPLPTTSGSNTSPPFFAEENVPSANVSERSIALWELVSSSKRCHTLSSRPSLVHSANRRWEVAFDGYPRRYRLMPSSSPPRQQQRCAVCLSISVLPKTDSTARCDSSTAALPE